MGPLVWWLMRLLHVMLRVGDLERSIAFYTDVLGMTLLRRKDYTEGRFTLAFLGYGPESDTTVLELTHNWDTPAYELGTAYGHLALGVDDIHGACAHIAERGGRVVRPPGPRPRVCHSVVEAFTHHSRRSVMVPSSWPSTVQ